MLCCAAAIGFGAGAQAQESLTIGHGRPAVEVNEAAMYFGLPGYHGPAYTPPPLYNPSRGRVTSRVIKLIPPPGLAPRPGMPPQISAPAQGVS